MIRIDMNIPEKCEECRFKDPDYCFCHADEEEKSIRDRGMRQYFCPLIGPEPVKKIRNEYTGYIDYKCPGCGAFLEKHNPCNPWKDVKFCCYCGQEVSWNG